MFHEPALFIASLSLQGVIYLRIMLEWILLAFV